MNPAPVEAIRLVARTLRPLRLNFAFLGGAVVPLLAGIDRLIGEARAATAQGLIPELLDFLPDATLTLRWLR